MPAFLRRPAGRIIRKARAGRDWAELHRTSLRCRVARGPRLLPPAELERLQAQFPFRTAYKYDPDSVRRRAGERVAAILRLPGAAAAEHVLELGCSEGTATALLHAEGRRATGIDLLPGQFDRRLLASGARLLAMNAEALAFRDSAFDFAFSFNSFEHFLDPPRVLGELARVVRPGGHIFLQFGPLYFSPWGAHAYRQITVPYAQCLFSSEVLEEYATGNGLGHLKDQHLNHWSLEQYHELWSAFSDRLQVVRYDERRDLSHLDIVRKYPSCFAGRGRRFDNFVVSHLAILFRRGVRSTGENPAT